ncbi:MAG: hypothetical protein LBM18_01350, partial [Oscillospiraceae bacterium]|nr:hypothetical protein [Oscillospiraceae bacterium]
PRKSVRESSLIALLLLFGENRFSPITGASSQPLGTLATGTGGHEQGRELPLLRKRRGRAMRVPTGAVGCGQRRKPSGIAGQARNDEELRQGRRTKGFKPRPNFVPTEVATVTK